MKDVVSGEREEKLLLVVRENDIIGGRGRRFGVGIPQVREHLFEEVEVRRGELLLLLVHV